MIDSQTNLKKRNYMNKITNMMVKPNSKLKAEVTKAMFGKENLKDTKEEKGETFKIKKAEKKSGLEK